MGVSQPLVETPGQYDDEQCWVNSVEITLVVLTLRGFHSPALVPPPLPFECGREKLGCPIDTASLSPDSDSY